MNAIVVYESMYGNTRAIGEAIAEAMGAVPVIPVSEAADEDGGGHVEPDATAEPGLREAIGSAP